MCGSHPSTNCVCENSIVSSITLIEIVCCRHNVCTGSFINTVRKHCSCLRFGQQFTNKGCCRTNLITNQYTGYRFHCHNVSTTTET